MTSCYSGVDSHDDLLGASLTKCFGTHLSDSGQEALMAVTKETKAGLLKKFQRADLDTGSPEVQVALLTARINDLGGHFKDHKKDEHGRRGMIRMVGQRRKLLDYLKKTNAKKYMDLIAQLDLRK